jgi:hypothetical protein
MIVVTCTNPCVPNPVVALASPPCFQCPAPVVP